MQKKQIRAYHLAWNPNTKAGAVFLDLGDGQPVRVPVASAEEFAAIAAVLNESPAFLEPNGMIVTGWEMVGGT